MFGRVKATRKACATGPVPSSAAISTSRARPSTRLAIVQPPTARKAGSSRIPTGFMPASLGSSRAGLAESQGFSNAGVGEPARAAALDWIRRRAYGSYREHFASARHKLGGFADAAIDVSHRPRGAALAGPAVAQTDSSALREAVTLEAIRAHQSALADIAAANGGTRDAGTPGLHGLGRLRRGEAARGRLSGHGPAVPLPDLRGDRRRRRWRGWRPSRGAMSTAPTS